MEKPPPRNRDKDRRAYVRFPVTLDLRYSTSGDAPVKMGTGHTVDLSSSGLRFKADRALRVGQRIKIYIDWPGRIGSAQVQHIIAGVVVRTDGTEIATRIQRHQMRIRSSARGHDKRSGG